MTPRTGRPPKDESDRRTEQVRFRLTAAELAAVQRAAGNQPVSAWARDRALAAAKRGEGAMTPDDCGCHPDDAARGPWCSTCCEHHPPTHCP